MRLDFTLGQEVEPFLLLGWAGLEPGFTWGTGARSVLALPAPDVEDEYALELRVFPFAGPGVPPQRLVVRANGTTLVRAVVTAETVLDLLVPWTALRGARELHVELDHPDAGRPVDFGMGEDRRQLAVALRAAWLRPLGLGAQGAAEGAGPSRPRPGASAMDQAMAMGFESLGANCEFGNVQSACGAEPPGLLRWAVTPLEALMAALAGNLEGIGEPGNLDLSLRGEEFYVTDRRYGTGHHTWRYRGQVEPDALLRSEARRIAYLARKLLEDLNRADKVFVFHDAGESGPAQARALLAALRRFGPARLLWVTRATAAAAPGTLERLEPGLVCGRLARFAPLQEAVHERTDIAGWMRLVRAVTALEAGAAG